LSNIRNKYLHTTSTETHTQVTDRGRGGPHTTR